MPPVKGPYGPGEAAKVNRAVRRGRRRKPPRTAASVVPGIGSVPAAKKRARAQRQTQAAKPLSPKPVRPQRVPSPRADRKVAGVVPGLGEAGRQTQPLSPSPRAQRDFKSGRPVRTPAQVRGVQKAAYDQLSGGAKRAHLAAAKKRLERGKATDYDKTILHAHTTRVEGSRKQVARSRSAEAQYLSQGEAVKLAAGDQEQAARRAAGKLALSPGRRFGETKGNKADILDIRTGKKVGEAGVVTGGIQQIGTGTGSVANLRGPVALVAPAASKLIDKTGAPKIVKTAAKEAADIAVAAPTAYAKFGVTAVTSPKKAAKMVADPYQQFVKNPKKYATQNPVSTALMVLGPVAGAHKAAGTAARRVGAQTSRRPLRELPNTPVRDVQPAARGVVTRAVQTARDNRRVKREGAPQVTQNHLNRRVDEEYAGGLRHQEVVEDHIIQRKKKIQARDRKQPASRRERKQQRRQEREELQEYRGVARDVARNSVRARFGREFGATARVENGKLVDRGGPEGQSYRSRDEAQAVADALNAKAPTIKKGHTGTPTSRLYAKEDVPVNFKPMQVSRGTGEGGEGGVAEYAVVPESVAQRLGHHERVGSSQSGGAKVLRESRRLFTSTVLPYSPTWLSGQAIEGTLRAALAGAGPASYARGRAYIKASERAEKGQGQRVKEIATPGGIATTSRAEFPRRPFHETFPDNSLARVLSDIGRKPGPAHVKRLNQKLTDVVFERVNGKFLEGIPQTAMLGRALRESPIMERGFGTRFNKALDETDKGITGSANQIALGREVQRMYGKYSGYSPKTREAIAHWTPFLPYYLNTARFVLSTLPRHHPLFLALTADLSRATEEWRKAKGLSLRHPETQRPIFMLGGFPVKGGTTVGNILGIPKGEEHLARVGHYTPSGPLTDISGATTGLLAPQFQGALLAGWPGGVDWKGDPLKHEDGRPFNPGEKMLYGTVQLAEAMTPLLSKTTDVFGYPLIGKTIGETGGKRAIQLARPLSTVRLQNQAEGGGGGGGLDLDLELSPQQLRSLDLGG